MYSKPHCFVLLLLSHVIHAHSTHTLEHTQTHKHTHAHAIPELASAQTHRQTHQFPRVCTASHSCLTCAHQSGNILRITHAMRYVFVNAFERIRCTYTKHNTAKTPLLNAHAPPYRQAGSESKSKSERESARAEGRAARTSAGGHETARCDDRRCVRAFQCYTTSTTGRTRITAANIARFASSSLCWGSGWRLVGAYIH